MIHPTNPLFNPNEYKNLIDRKFKEAKEKGISRMDKEWGIWSANMNRKLREKIKEAGKFQIFYKYTFVYWVLMSQLLELYYCGGDILSKIKISKKWKEINEVQKVFDGKEIPMDIPEDEILKMVLQK